MLRPADKILDFSFHFAAGRTAVLLVHGLTGTPTEMKGIGQRIAVGLAEAGASVGCFDLARSSSGLNETVKKIEGTGQRGLVLTGDVTKPESLSTAISTLEKELGPLSVAANCAGVADAAPAEEMPLSQWQRVFDINTTGVFLSCQAEAKVMLPRKEG